MWAVTPLTRAPLPSLALPPCPISMDPWLAAGVCPGRDELKHVLLYLFEYFLLCPVLPSPSFSWHAQTGSAGRCLCDAAVTTPSRFSGVDRPPWHREAAARNPAPTRSWDDCAGARPAVLGFELVLPGIMRPLSYPPTLRAVLWHTRLWVQWWHWWLLYILNKLSIFHIILFESIML